jgi:hypothetical protein
MAETQTKPRTTKKRTTTTKAVTKAKPKDDVTSVSLNIEGLIAKAIEAQMPPDTLERFLKMRDQLKAEWAEEQFYKALAAFQTECPVIKKTKAVLNKDKKSVRYRYAPLDSIVEQVRDPLAKHGFSYTLDSEFGDSSVVAIMKLHHLAGHSETTTFRATIDKDAYMNEMQKGASAHTFAKRYAFCNGLGVLTGDEDDDGQEGGKVEPQGNQEQKPPARNREQDRNKKAQDAYNKKIYDKLKEEFIEIMKVEVFSDEDRKKSWAEWTGARQKGFKSLMQVKNEWADELAIRLDKPDDSLGSKTGEELSKEEIADLFGGEIVPLEKGGDQ